MFGLGAPLTFGILVLIAIISGVKILKEYERAVVFRLGRMVGSRGPGLVYIIPGIEKMVRHFSARAGNVAQCLRPRGVGRAFGREGKNQRPDSGDSGRPDRTLGN
jgi:regulator of protease activity HflC (stomatin/prohibitin superfamily)